jgi:cell wall-associated NlpC family hydrolase
MTPIGAIVGWTKQVAADYRASHTTETFYTFSSVKDMLNNELKDAVNTKIASFSDNYPGLVVVREDEGDGVGNWKEVVSVYVSLYWVGDTTDIENMTDARIEQLRGVFFDMNPIKATLKEIPYVPPPTPTPMPASSNNTYIPPTATPTPPTTSYSLTINVDSISANAMVTKYNMTDDQKIMLSNMLTFEPSVWATFLGERSIPLTSVEFDALIEALPNGVGKSILLSAREMLGWNYSQSLAGVVDGYADCSYLAQTAYASVGIAMPRTSYQQGKWCSENGYKISFSQLQPGDLIFQNLKESDNFKGITHVSIYCGNGMVVEASSRLDAIVFRPLWGTESIVFIAHPY